MRHATGIHDLGVEGVEEILARALAWKLGPHPKHLVDKILGMVFFNPSLRTRASFEAVMARGGGSSIVLEVGNGVWKLEDREGAVMDGDRAEHIKEAAPVLSRYVDMLAVRTFAANVERRADNADPVMNGFRSSGTVPTISMESAREHPCQGLADLLTARETFGSTKGLPVTLAWAPHIKPLPKAVPNSFLLTAAAAGLRGAGGPPQGLRAAPQRHAPRPRPCARATGGSVAVTNDLDPALEGTRVIYAKAWGPSTASGLERRGGQGLPGLAVPPRPLRQGAPRKPSSCTACRCAATWKWPTACWTAPGAGWWTRPRTASTCSARSSSGCFEAN